MATKYTNPLDQVKIAAACAADWDEMIGTERIRFCGQCKLNVYNLSEMNRGQAESLIASAEGRLCVRFYRRADGTILTENCPVGLRAIKRRLSRAAGAALSTILSFLAGLGLYTALEEREPMTTMGVIAVTTPMRTTTPAVPLHVEQGEIVMPVLDTPDLLPDEEFHPQRTRAGKRKR